MTILLRIIDFFAVRLWLLALLLFAASAGALAMAYISEYFFGLKPCILCWYQRYAFMASGALALLALIFRNNATLCRLLLWVAGLGYVINAGIAFFQVGVEELWWRGTDACHAPELDLNSSLDDLRESLLAEAFVPCDVVQWSLFGISMAGYNIPYSLGLAVLAFIALLRKPAQS
jgi:disulfide bond formation protein DsbB